jgi:hypothetical protein
VDSIPGAQPVVVAETGEILDVTPKVLPHAEQDFGMSPAEPAAPSVASNGTTPAEKLTAWCTNAHRNSRGPCTPDTYGYLVGVIDAICDGADAHKRILSRLTGSDISRDNRPGLDLASNLLRWLPETLTVAAGGGPNPQYKPEYVAVIQRLWRDLTGQLELSV